MRRRQQQLDCAICVFLFSIPNKDFAREVWDFLGKCGVSTCGTGQIFRARAALLCLALVLLESQVFFRGHGAVSTEIHFLHELEDFLKQLSASAARYCSCGGTGHCKCESECCGSSGGYEELERAKNMTCLGAYFHCNDSNG